MERVTFQNKGNTVVGNLFKPDGTEQGTRYPAIVVTHPFGAVKVSIAARYPLKEIAKAHDHVDAGSRGRILVSLPE